MRSLSAIVAEQYRAMPCLAGIEPAPKGPNHNAKLRGFKLLANIVDYQFDQVKRMVDVVWIQGDPYENADDMFADVFVNNRLQIFVGGTSAVLSPTVNLKLRAVHDYLAHYLPRNQFGLQGEARAFLAHVSTFKSLAGLPEHDQGLAAMALASEILGQTCCHDQGFGFPKQKLNFLPWSLGQTLDIAKQLAK